MTLEDLRTSMNNVFNHWVDIEEDEEGQIIIKTGLRIEPGTDELVEMDS